MTKHLSELCSQLGKARNRQAKLLQENVRVTKRAFGHTVTPLVLAQLKSSLEISVFQSRPANCK